MDNVSTKVCNFIKMKAACATQMSRKCFFCHDMSLSAFLRYFSTINCNVFIEMSDWGCRLKILTCFVDLVG